MKDIFITYGSLVTPIGNSISENYSGLLKGKSGVKATENCGFNQETWQIAKIEEIKEDRYSTLLKKGCIELKSNISKEKLQSPNTLVIVSTTKGDIEEFPNDTFSSSTQVLKQELQLFKNPIIISNACISGVIAINTAADYIRFGTYETVIVMGIDVVSDFVIYGFQSLFALSDEFVKPFDKERKGIALGEGIASVILSDKKINDNFHAKYLNGSATNDANHISGPSRTGEGLVRSIQNTLQRSNINVEEIDFVSAHGTGTIYNDEMESIAFNRTGLQNTPLNSLKGYFGHTLGAAGVIEVIVCLLSMENNILFKSLGFDEVGTSKEISLLKDNQKTEINTVLKTASGFGGGNASLLLIKE